MPASQLPGGGTLFSAQHPFDWPPLPGNVYALPAWPLGEGVFLLDDTQLDYGALSRLLPGPGVQVTSGFQTMTITTNDLSVELNGLSHVGTEWTADLTIHPPWNDTNLTYDLFRTENLGSREGWRLLRRCLTTNVTVSGLPAAREFFAVGHTNGVLTVSTNVTAQEMAELLVPPFVIVTNAVYTGSVVARGTFTGGNGCGLPIESGVILSSGWITNAIGPNSDNGLDAAGVHGGGPSDLGRPGDDDLNDLVGNSGTTDAAVLEFDILSTNAFPLRFRYIFASEEYPEWIGSYNDPFAIFVITNRVGTNWMNSITNDLALVPGTGNLPVSVNSINGGCTADWYGHQIPSTNPQYYIDNHDPNYSALTGAVAAPVFNIQYDGMTVLLTVETPVLANATTHIKLAISDYGGGITPNNPYWDSAAFVEAWLP